MLAAYMAVEVYIIDTIRARREALAAEIAQAQAEYERLEQMLREYCRGIDMQTGGLKELDALLAELSAEEAPDALTNGVQT